MEGDFFILMLLAGGTFYVMLSPEEDDTVLASKDLEVVRQVVTDAERDADAANVALFRVAFDPRIVMLDGQKLEHVVGLPYTVGDLTYGATEITAARCGNQRLAAELWVEGLRP